MLPKQNPGPQKSKSKSKFKLKVKVKPKYTRRKRMPKAESKSERSLMLSKGLEPAVTRMQKLRARAENAGVYFPLSSSPPSSSLNASLQRLADLRKQAAVLQAAIPTPSMYTFTPRMDESDFLRTDFSDHANHVERLPFPRPETLMVPEPVSTLDHVTDPRIRALLQDRLDRSSEYQAARRAQEVAKEEALRQNAWRAHEFAFLRAHDTPVRSPPLTTSRLEKFLTSFKQKSSG